MYRVAFHWLEAEPQFGGTVPIALTEALDPHRLVMKGTKVQPTRCIALDSEIGQHALCTIYAQRPSVCREVAASWEFGEVSPQCDKARAAHGLPLLTPADWPPSVLPAVAANDGASAGHDHDDEPPSPRLPPVAA